MFSKVTTSLTGRAIALACFGLATMAPTQAQSVWDNGGTTSSVAASGQSLPITLTTSGTGADIIGGERDLSLGLVSSNGTTTGAGSSNSLSVGNDPFYGGSYIDVARAVGVSGTSSVVWDGVDGSSAINYTGLGGMNLSSLHSGIEFKLSKDSPPTEWKFTFYSDASRFSVYTLSLGAGSIDHNSPSAFYSIPFGTFTATGSLGGANFANIGAI